MSACSEFAKLRPRTEKTVDTWLDAQSWKDYTLNGLISKKKATFKNNFDAGSVWIEAIIGGDRPTEVVIHWLCTIFVRFGVSHKLGSDNAKEFINDKIVTWLQAQGCINLASPIYNPRSYGLAERSVQTVKKAMRWRSSSFCVNFRAFLLRVLFTHRNTSSVRGKTPSKLLLGRKIRHPAVINYCIGELAIFRAGPHTASFLAMYVVGKGYNTAWLIQEHSFWSERTILAKTSTKVTFPNTTTIAPDPVTARLPQMSMSLWYAPSNDY